MARPRTAAPRRAATAVALLVALVAWPRTAWAQVESIASTAPVLSPVGLWRSAAEEGGPGALAPSLTLRITNGASQFLATIVDHALNNFPTPVTVTTEWSLTTVLSRIDLVGYFSTPAAALSTTGASIASSRVLGRMVTGRATTYRPFTEAAMSGVGVPGASLHLFRQLVIGPLNGTGRRTDQLELQLDLRGLAPLTPGTYTGTLTLRAIAY
jgi:hypothetical protein